ncbi:MAG: substrate-binding domain-containing protein [Actinomycetota bacterium]|nr:substrate-binding domain-containing protein [Actinomycetota bacterium]MDD5666894.1 substrate-binding domain-containing protein [Actinomycetota bacterium]
MKKWIVFITGLIVALSLVAAITGCGEEETKPEERTELILATTTSTQDSGLLDEWVPMFEEENPYVVKVIAVGSGAAMEMGRNGECDVMLVHSPAAEEELVEEGYAVDRNAVMHNDFIIVGPASNPANIADDMEAKDAFAAISTSQSKFISRADESGTHTKELNVWKAAGISPEGAWYVESGKGMGDTLRIASEEGAYTLSDRGTYLSMKDELELEILSEGDPILFNNYHVMNVNPEKWPDVNHEGAKAFNQFCVSPQAQEFLDEFGVEEYGQPLFYPDAL